METAAVTPATPKPPKDEVGVFSYYLKVKGVFGRNRSVKFKVFDVLLDVDPLKPGIDTKKLDEMAKAVLVDIKFKSGTAVFVEQPETLTTYAEGWTSRSYMVFSDVKLFRLDRTPGQPDITTYGANASI